MRTRHSAGCLSQAYSTASKTSMGRTSCRKQPIGGSLAILTIGGSRLAGPADLIKLEAESVFGLRRAQFRAEPPSLHTAVKSTVSLDDYELIAEKLSDLSEQVRGIENRVSDVLTRMADVE